MTSSLSGHYWLSTLFLASGTPREELAARLPAGLPPAGRAALLAGLAVAPEERPAEAGALVGELRTAVETGRSGASTGPSPVSRAKGIATPQTTAAMPHIARGTPPLEIEWCDVPSGDFLMGSAEDDGMAFDDEKPQRRVYVDAFRIGKYPVTNAQYRAFVVATGHSPPGHWKGDEMPAGEENHPVVEVNWEDAVAFCGWASEVTGEQIRLPTEAEWEKGARGTDGRRYPWGNEWQEGRCNTAEAGVGDTTAVGRYQGGVSPYGAHDMAGNVWEWTDSWYQAYPGSTYEDENYGREKRVLRGCSWDSVVGWYVRAADRYGFDPSFRDLDVGFRCASTSP